jgi:spore coat polysaccharide biosynthesis predicted glycosyltransferase SpsG
MIQGDAKYDLHGADLTHSDYTFCFSSELMEGKTYEEYRRKGVNRSKVVFVGRDYSAELESGTLRKEDRDFLAEIEANRLSSGSNRKLVFISLGTQAQQPRYFNEYVMDALRDSNVTVVLQLSSGAQVTDEEFESWRRRAPGNFVLYAACKPHACLMHLLREADLFISHVGRNSLMEAISQGTPILALPVSGDQYDNAKVVASEGLGQAIGTGEFPADLTWKAIVNNGRWTKEPPSDVKAGFVCLIREAVHSLLGNDDLQAVVQDKRKLAAGLGFDVARDIILGVVNPAKYTS